MNSQALDTLSSSVSKEVVLALISMVQERISSESASEYNLIELKDCVRMFNDAFCSVWTEKNLFISV